MVDAKSVSGLGEIRQDLLPATLVGRLVPLHQGIEQRRLVVEHGGHRCGRHIQCFGHTRKRQRLDTARCAGGLGGAQDRQA
jgi:hypothetical protein